MYFLCLYLYFLLYVCIFIQCFKMLFFLGKSNIPSFIHSFIHSSIYLFTLRWLDKITGFNYNFKSKNINISKYENFVHHSLIHPGNIYLLIVNNRNTKKRCEKYMFKVNNKNTRTTSTSRN